MRIFDQDSGFSKYGAIVFDLIQLNFLVLTITILTAGLGFGAAVTAMIFSIDRTIFEGNGYALRNFVKSLKLNWKQASILWICSMAIMTLSRIAIDILSKMDGFISSFSIVHMAIILEVIFILIYAIPTMALVDVKLKELVQNAFALAHRHLLTTITCVLLIALGIYLTFELHGIFLLFLASGVGVMINQLVVRTVLIKYFTDEQKQSLFANTICVPKDYNDL